MLRSNFNVAWHTFCLEAKINHSGNSAVAREKIESSGLFFIFELCPLARRMKRIRKSHFLFVSPDLEPKGFCFSSNPPASLLLCAEHTLFSLIPSAMAVVSALPVNKMSALLDPFLSLWSVSPRKEWILPYLLSPCNIWDKLYSYRVNVLLLLGSLCNVSDSHTDDVKLVTVIRTGKGRTAKENHEVLLMKFCFPCLLICLVYFELVWNALWFGMYAMTTGKCLLCFFALYVANVWRWL